MDIGERVGDKAAEEDVELVGVDDERVAVSRDSLGMRALETEGAGKPEGPTNKLLPAPTDTAVVPPTTPSAEGTTGSSSD